MQNPIFSVSEFNEMLNFHLAQLGEVVVEGEISRIDVSRGQWLFITIKDEYAAVDVFGVAFQLSGWRALEEGMKVHVYGVASIHQRSGKFSIRAEGEKLKLRLSVQDQTLLSQSGFNDLN